MLRLLHPVIESDLPILFEHQDDLDASVMAGVTPRDQEAFMAKWAEVLANPECLPRTIRTEGEVVGWIGSFMRDGKREVGYWLGRRHWGRGLATRALAEFLQLDPTRPLHAGVCKRNPASVRVLEKCGFVITEELSEEVLLTLHVAGERAGDSTTRARVSREQEDNSPAERRPPGATDRSHWRGAD